MELIIAEKSLDIAHELSYMLLSFGIKSILVSNRLEAIKQWEMKPELNLAIIDIDNKNVEGLELMAELTEKNPGSFRFIIHSAASVDELPEKINNSNVIGYISKPFDYGRVESSLKIIFSTMNFPDIDKRQHLRIIPDKDELLRAHFKLKGSSRFLCGRILNLSLGGVALQLLNVKDEQLSEGTSVPYIELGLNCKQIVTYGTIHLKRGNLVAIHFQCLDREMRNTIAKYILKRIS